MSKTFKPTKKGLRESWINRLPHELLAKFFIFAHSQARSSHGSVGARHYLASVCCFWHEVAISTPVLWDYISLPSTVGRLVDILKRSKQTPVDVSINTD